MSPASDLLAHTLAQTDFHPGLPQQRRLYEAAKAAIHQHQLGAGNKLPSSRDLARDLRPEEPVAIPHRPADA